MAHPQIAAFARLATENAQPHRMIAGQATLLSRTMHDIRYDAVHDEFLVTNPFAHAVLTFRGGANGEEAPVRVIQGAKTGLGDTGRDPRRSTEYQYGVDRVEIDPIHDEIFVPARDRILVYPRTANGDVAPIRVIRGPDTQLGYGARSLAVDPVRNLLVVGGGRTFLIFNRADEGNVKPMRVITGPDVGAGGGLHITPKGWIVSVVGNADVSDGSSFIGIWNVDDHGEVPPRWKIAGSKSALLRPRGVAINPTHKEVYVADMNQNAVLTYYFPEIF